MRVAHQLRARTGRTIPLAAPLGESVNLRARQRITAEAIDGLKFAERLLRRRPPRSRPSCRPASVAAVKAERLNPTIVK